MADIKDNADLEATKNANQESTVDEPQNAAQKHMGATENGEDNEVRKTKPPTQSMAELTNKKGQATPPDPDDFNPGDMITPG